MFGFQIQIIEGLGWLDSRLLTETKSPSLYKQIQFWSSSINLLFLPLQGEGIN